MAKKKLVFSATPQAQQAQQEDSSFLDSAWSVAEDVWDAVSEPAGAVLDTLSYLDKPRGAIAGGVKAALDNTDIIEGVKNGWDKNTSWGEVLFSDEFRKEDPYYAATIGGIAADVIADPLWFLPIGKVANGVAKVGDVTGINRHIVNPAINAVRNSDAGRRAIAFGEDVLGKNRVNDAGIERDFNYGRAQDLQYADDLADPLREYKKLGGGAEDATNYIEAAERSSRAIPLDAGRSDAIMDSFLAGNLASDIAQGVFSKEEALNAFRNSARGLDDATEQMREASSLVRGKQDEIEKARRLAERERISREKEIASMRGEQFAFDDAARTARAAAQEEISALREEAGRAREAIQANRENLRAETSTMNDAIKTWQDDVGKIRESGTTRKLRKQGLRNRLKEINAMLKTRPASAQALLQEKDIIKKELERLKAEGLEADAEISAIRGTQSGIRDARAIAKESAGERISELQTRRNTLNSNVGAVQGTSAGVSAAIKGREAGAKSITEILKAASKEADAASASGIEKLNTELAGLQENLAKASKNLKRARQGTKIPDYLLQQHQVDALEESAKRQRALAESLKHARAEGLTDSAKMIQEAMKHEKVRAYANLPEYKTREMVLNEIQDVNLRNALKAAADPIVKRIKEDTEKLRAAGLLDDADYVHFLGGSHLRRAYEKFETPKDYLDSVKKHGTNEEYAKAFSEYQKMYGAEKAGFGAPAHKINMRDFMKRQRLSTETLQKMGLVEDAEYRVMDTLNRSSKALRESDYLSQVAEKFGKNLKEAAELSRNLPESRQYVPVPNTSSYGALAGKWIPKDVADQVLKRMGMTTSKLPQAWQKAVSVWKVGKLSNPASIMRNFYSGLPMANVFGKVPMKEMPRLITKAAAAMGMGKKGKPGTGNAMVDMWLGNQSKLYREYAGSGAKESKLTREELSDILEGETKGIISSIRNGDVLEGAGKAFRKAGQVGMKAFNVPDDFWRLVTFTYYREQGKSIKEAGDIARKALLDYQNTPEWVAKLASSGVVPFARFPYHATKATAKALWNDTAHVSAYYKPANQSDKDERDILPKYLKPQNLIPMGESTKTVDGKEIPVRNHVDVSYVLPFANDLSVGNPIIDLIQLKKTGQNGLGQQVIRPGMSFEDKAKAVAEMSLNSIAPSILSKYTWEKPINAITGTVDRMGRQYDVPSALANSFLGIKNVPINVDEEYEKRQNDIKYKMRNIQSEINRIEKDKSLTEEQKQEDILSHQRRKENLDKEAKGLAERYHKANPNKKKKDEPTQRKKKKLRFRKASDG